MADNTQALEQLTGLWNLIHPDTVVHNSTAATVASWLSGRIHIWVVNMEVTANVDGVTFRVQGRNSSDANGWIDIQAITTKTTASGAQHDITGVEAIAQTELALDADPTSDFLPGDGCYLHDTNGGSPSNTTEALTTDEGDSAFTIVNNVTTGPDILNVTDGILTALDSLDEVQPDVETFAFDIFSLGGYDSIRVLVEHRGATGSDIHYKVEGEFVTDIE